jgi:hypothetical protein
MVTIASDAADDGEHRACSRPVTEVMRSQGQYAHLVNNVQSHVKIDAVHFPA